MSPFEEKTSAETQVRPWILGVAALLIAAAAIFLPRVFRDDQKETPVSQKNTKEVSSLSQTDPTPTPKDPSSAETAPTAEVDFNEESPFLETDYEPLAKWFDERFEVSYKNMTPELIFDQAPLNDIYYEVTIVPKNPDKFNFDSEDISRRELLKAIADHWGLEMSLALDESGTPTAVKVVGPEFL